VADKQNKQFIDWIMRYLPESNKVAGALTLDPLDGDAGFRRYYRLNTIPSLIAVDSPPLQENIPAYVSISLALLSAGIKRPQIHAVDFTKWFLLLEDFGGQLLQPLLEGGALEESYDQAESTLCSIQKMIFNPEIFPLYDRGRLKEELDLFSSWFVTELLGVAMGDQAKVILENLADVLIENALCQPQVVVHRDYHSRNLMILNDGQMGVIDFQDAVFGPITYDLVSLLKDCYHLLPRGMTASRALNYKRRLEAEALITSVDDRVFLRWFDLMGLQRHIKVMGIFARLALRDEKHRYLQNLPLVIAYVLDVSNQYTETQEFSLWFDSSITPALLTQKWYKETPKLD
jgi:hypothetical protein